MSPLNQALQVPKMRMPVVTFLLVLSILLPSLSSALPQQTKDRPQLEHFSDAQLVGCFSENKKCHAEDWDIAKELARRKNVPFLTRTFQDEQDLSVRAGIIHALYLIHMPEVEKFMRQTVEQKIDDGEERYYPLNYLAKKCDAHALDVLCVHGKGGFPGYPGCLEWGETVELFGKCRYKPAVPYLLDSLNTACLNISGAALDSLRRIFPGAPENFDSPEAARAYFVKRAKQETKSKKEAASPSESGQKSQE